MASFTMCAAVARSMRTPGIAASMRSRRLSDVWAPPSPVWMPTAGRSQWPTHRLDGGRGASSRGRSSRSRASAATIWLRRDSAASGGELRRRKGREAKPLALMVREPGGRRGLCVVSTAERELLSSTARPIVLLERRPEAGSAPGDEVAPRLRELGVMLPLHAPPHLLLEAVGSAARDDQREPQRRAHCVSTTATRSLGCDGIADLFLGHDRPIQVRCDDSVARVIGGAPVAPAARAGLRAAGASRLPLARRRRADPCLSAAELKNVVRARPWTGTCS